MAICSFLTPKNLKGPDFFVAWKKWQGEPLEQQVVIQLPRPVDMSALAALFAGNRFAVLKGVDPNANNLVAAGAFQSGNVQSLVLARLESNAQAKMVRMTLKTGSDALTAAFKNVLGVQLGW